ncbi:prolyl oligopeptidase family serine peptidase [Actinomadura sp. ATCC 31491]|uniref:Prolyl oligopeptidase family serine peptidase n=1 Tax=Actinomadura luzonensis TaxID=2805427 RepID=A0ABT0FN91_9ACTN|nr:prolyl oligopeptidase family serine peptidase [Actinomadura luzonensis]MCK2213719.1 prolyl oligopeptidase family serine peptidase [Actinomadura luzonensis]
MTTATSTPRATAHRLNFRFSPGGRYAACLVAGGSAMRPEVWDLTGAGPRPRAVRTGDGESATSVPLPTDEGDLFLCRSGPYGSRLTFAACQGRDTAEETELMAVRRGGLGLVPGTAGTPALVLELDGDGGTTVWRLPGGATPPERIAEVPHPIGATAWLDERGDRLALGAGVLDLALGTVTPLGLPEGEHLLMAAPRAGVLLTAVPHGSGYRLGVRTPGEPGPARLPERLNAVEGSVTPLALDPGGRFLALSLTRRARSHLLLHDLAADTSSEIELPPGILYPAACWPGDGLRLVHSAGDRPAGVVMIPDPSRPRVLAATGAPWSGWAAPRTRDYPAQDGVTEAVVYGDPAAAPGLVVALHGGPEAAWRLGFDPLFQRLAAEGIAVVAPNQRGSTGYGAAHREAVRGAWGGPDLADLLRLGRHLAAERAPGLPRPMLYGVSYGAYLALLAAAAEPDLWGRAVAVAPFLSGPLLYEDGSEQVRDLIDRLGGREDVHDDLGPRDLLRLAHRIRLPLLIVHGEHDPVIPVGHSRRLRERLRATGHPGAAYLEVPDAGHDPLSDLGGHAARERVLGFLDQGAAR